MLYCPITSGSKGNCHFIAGEGTAVLVDAGTNAKNITAQLATLGVRPGELSGILLTHEHIDHIAALEVLVRKNGLSVYCNEATMEAVIKRFPSMDTAAFNIFRTGESFYIDDLEITPFKTPHDAAESVGYSIGCGLRRVCIATDIGHMTKSLAQQLEGAQLVCIESNHDEKMLAEGPYPFALKRRILGSNGHLSNTNCGRTLCSLLDKGLCQAVLCHLSHQNNTPELAYRTVAQELLSAGASLPVDIAYQDRRGAVYDIARITHGR